ncbi:hypothetical protein ASE73_02510 [Sphingomonas sp. Leaf24]|uniref:hypothetical protein n=1 Tax=unclassified Sphingomonas TaxID=196159 RepID=UPI0007019800|nr:MULTISPECIES: hypothetical protein [unclassified Sphingomonas]KQM23115.1 hypothetical protein ASE50_02510 [Sphingomonas sp. Leaf5]KQM95973.1 hypothetical protein ASE73_02510 [Sphingomonas sp. Leaf24]
MTPNLRTHGLPSAIAAGTHQPDDGLPEPTAFDPVAAGVPELVAPVRDILDPFDVGGLSPRLVAVARMIRPLCVGALMAIPTLGPASVGLVAIVAPDRALAMAEASTRFLVGIPGDIVALIGFLAGGYGLAKTIEKRVGKAS